MILNCLFELGRIFRGLKCLNTKSVDKKKKDLLFVKSLQIAVWEGVLKRGQLAFTGPVVGNLYL